MQPANFGIKPANFDGFVMKSHLWMLKFAEQDSFPI